MSRHHSWPILPDGRQVRINATSHVLEVFDTDLTTLLHQTSSTGGLLYPFLKTAAGVVNADITADITAGRLAVGDAIVTGSYYQGLAVGGNVYEVVAGATATEDGGLYVNAGTLQLHGMIAESGMNATQWGAKADGTTDDTARIQAAINGIPLNSTLLLPDGSRCITTLTVARRIKLRGGRLSWTAGITNADAITVTADGVEFHDVTLINPNELGAATGNRNIGIRFTANEGTVSGCTIQQFQNGVAVSADGEWARFKIVDNRIIDIVGVGGGPASASTDGEDRGDGIVVWGAQATITGNVVSAKATTDARIGIHCEGLPGFAGTPGNYSSAQYTISDNIVYGQFRRGISVEDVSEAAVTGNTVADSTWWAVSLAANCRASHLTGNTILWTRAATDNQGSAFTPTRGPIMAYGTTHDSVIAGNTIRIAGTAAAAIIVQGVDGSNRNNDCIVSGNTFYVESGSLTDGIKADNTARLRITGNKGSGFTALGVNAFQADAIELVDNHLRAGAGATVGIQTSGTCTSALVDRNIIETVATGINLNNHTGRVTVTDNDLRTVATSGVDLFGCTTGKVWGNSISGAGTLYANIAAGIQREPYITGGAGTPEGAITAPVGSTYHRSDGAAATTLYVKETGAGNTGWVAVGGGGGGANGTSGDLQFASPTGTLLSDTALNFNTTTDVLTVPNLWVTGTQRYFDPVNTTQLTANVNDWAPFGAGNLVGAVWTIDADINGRTVTGIDATGINDGACLTLINTSPSSIILAGLDGASAAANRFGWNTSVTLRRGEGVTLIYSTVNLKWQATSVVGPTLTYTVEHTDSVVGAVAVDDATSPAWAVPITGTLAGVRVTCGAALVGGTLTVTVTRISPLAFAANPVVTVATGALTTLFTPGTAITVAPGDLLVATVTALTATNITSMAVQYLVESA